MKKIQYLDGLRGLAAFVVVFHHFILAFFPALFFSSDPMTHFGAGKEHFLSGTALNIFYGGNFAVCIFFVLSGFVLSHKFFLQKDHEIITESAVKRYFRMVVPVAFSVLLAFVLMSFSLFYNQQASGVSGSDWLGGFWQFTPSFGDAMNQIFLGTFFSNIFQYNVTLWTIAFEFVGSFLIFGFMALFGKMKNRYWAYIFAIVFFFQTYYLAFFLGMLLSDVMAHKDMIVRKFDKSKVLRTLMLLIGLFFGSYPAGRSTDGTIYGYLQNPLFNDAAVTYHILGAFLVMIVLLDSKRMQKLFSSRYLLFLGEVSFAMYLLHFIVIGSFSSFVFLQLVSHMPYVAAVSISFVLSVVLLLLVSYFVYVYVDKKAVHLSKLIYQRIFKH